MEETLKREILLNGYVDDVMVKEFYEETDKIIKAYEDYLEESQFIKKDKLKEFEPIVITINSLGGGVYSGNAIIQRIEQMQEGFGIPLIANIVTAMSMAFIIALSIDIRIGHKYASLMNHASSNMIGGYIENIKTDLKHMEILDSKYEHMILERTKIPQEEIEKSRLNCVFYDYEEALKRDIINLDIYAPIDEEHEEEDEEEKELIIATHKNGELERFENKMNALKEEGYFDDIKVD